VSSLAARLIDDSLRPPAFPCGDLSASGAIMLTGTTVRCVNL
jgi:hypothetical protein